MNSNSEFIFTDETKAVLPYITQFGEYHSLVIHEDSMYELPLSQLNTIDLNLRYNHSSLRGAKDSAAHILGATKMIPVVMNAAKRHIWFSTEAYKKITNIWLALHHIVGEPEPIGEEQTLVYLTGGWELVIPVKCSSFIKRLNNAHRLRSHTLGGNLIYNSNEKKQVMLVSDGHRVEYKLKCEQYERKNYVDHNMLIQ